MPTTITPRLVLSGGTPAVACDLEEVRQGAMVRGRTSSSSRWSWGGVIATTGEEARLILDQTDRLVAVAPLSRARLLVPPHARVEHLEGVALSVEHALGWYLSAQPAVLVDGRLGAGWLGVRLEGVLGVYELLGPDPALAELQLAVAEIESSRLSA